MSKNKINKDTVPEDFTLGLVLVDALPVLFFGASMILLGVMFSSVLFMIGAIACFYAGACKVLWKLIVVLRKKNIWWMFMQMRIVMPLGFLCMPVALIVNRSRVNGAAMWAGITSLPSLIFFILGIAGMGLMFFFAFNLDSSDVKSNWIEQLTNGIAQCAFFLGILFIFI